MKVTATATLTTSQITTLTARLKKLVEGNPQPWDSPHGDDLTLTQMVMGFTCNSRTVAGNWMGVTLEGATLTISAATRRNALICSGNNVGVLFLGLFAQKVDIPGGYECRLDLPLLESLSIQEYDSWRKDVKFWESGLESPEVVELRRKAELVGFALPTCLLRIEDGALCADYDPQTAEAVYLPLPLWDGVHYRRAAAQGVSL